MSKYRPKGTTTRKLEDSQVIYYRKAYKEGWLTRRGIMLQAGVSMPTVDRMLNGETYQHLGVPGAERVEMVGGVTAAELEESAQRLFQAQQAQQVPPNPLDE